MYAMKKNFCRICLTAMVVLLMNGCTIENKPEVSDPTAMVDMTESTAPPVTETATEPEAQLSPDFTVYDADGKQTRLSDYFGKPIVLNFWASWCGPCKGEMPDFQEKFEQLGEDVQFLMINLTDGNTETVETASGFIADMGYTFPVFYDQDSDAARTYGIRSIPTTYFIDADGYPVAQATGALDAETLQRGIDMIV